MADSPELALEQAVKAFESQFQEVVDYNPSHPRADRCPRHNLPYIIFHNGIAKKEGAPSPRGGTSTSPEEAVQAFLFHLKHWVVGPAKTLFWRARPELENEGNSWRVYCRAVWV